MTQHHYLVRLLTSAMVAGLWVTASTAIGNASPMPSPPKNGVHRSGRISVFVPPKGTAGAPRTTASTATRDRRSCRSAEPLQLALTDPGAIGPSARPQFSLYVPPSSARQVVLALRNESIGFYERVTLPLPAEPGWLTLQWPEGTAALDGRLDYDWFVVVMCGSSAEPDDPTFSGSFLPGAKTVTAVP
jgi:hypothetical protein